MPGLLILDGLSANAGHEGFDQDRIHDVYGLLSAVADQYRDALQVVAVDNYLASNILDEYAGDVILTLSQSDRLIRVPPSSPPEMAERVRTACTRKSDGMRGNMARRMDEGAPAPVAEREARQLKR
jgi:hypothetical protein